MGLLEYRQQLDEIDAQIVKLFEERMSISEKVAEDSAEILVTRIRKETP